MLNSDFDFVHLAGIHQWTCRCMQQGERYQTVYKTWVQYYHYHV